MLPWQLNDLRLQLGLGLPTDQLASWLPIYARDAQRRKVTELAAASFNQDTAAKVIHLSWDERRRCQIK